MELITVAPPTEPAGRTEAGQNGGRTERGQDVGIEMLFHGIHVSNAGVRMKSWPCSTDS